MNTISPTGLVHAVDETLHGSNPPKVQTKCTQTTFSFHTYRPTYFHPWPIVSHSITCKRCLKIMEEEASTLKKNIDWIESLKKGDSHVI